MTTTTIKLHAGLAYELALDLGHGAGRVGEVHARFPLGSDLDVAEALGREGVRPSIARLALAMEQQMRRHDAEWGPAGYLRHSEAELGARLAEEARELLRFEGTPRERLGEAADVACYALMLVERMGRR
jgi:hypothetical protein